MESKKIYFLHPFLFTAYFVVSIYAANIDQVPFLDAFKSFVFVNAIAGLLVIFLLKAAKEENRASFLSSLVVISILYFGQVYKGIIQKTEMDFLAWHPEVVVLVWFLIFGMLGSSHFWKQLSNPRIVTTALNIVASVAVVFPLLIIGYFFYQKAEVLVPIDLHATIKDERFFLRGESKPDIYYIIVDGYGRADILRELYNFENQELISYLQNKGFYVAESSHSNYIETYLSLASSLNFSYLNDLSPIIGIPWRWQQFSELVRQSQVRSLLEENGYKTVSFSTGFSRTEIRDANLFFSPYSINLKSFLLSDFDWLLLSMTVFEVPLQAVQSHFPLPIPNYHSHQSQILFTLEKLREMPGVDGPKFVFAHIISPHPPFVFSEDGALIQVSHPYTKNDGSFFDGTKEEYINGYVGQVKFLNRMLKDTIDSILEDSQEPPIIILQGDHGPGAFLDWHSMENSCLPERTSILNAYYLPGQGHEFLYPSISPVNTFRVIFNTYFDTTYEILEDRSHYSSWKQPQTLIDITTEVNNWENCNFSIK